MIPSKIDVPVKDILPAPTGALKACGRSSAENCARIRDLGFTTSKHITMYGERFELLSDPFVEGDCTAVRAIGGNNPAIRVLRLPVSIILGLAHRFRKN